MKDSEESIFFSFRKPSKPLDDFVHIYWTHKYTAKKAITVSVLPDSYFKLIIIQQRGRMISYFMTGLWSHEMEFTVPAESVLYGIKFKILSPEFLFQNEIASIFRSHKDLTQDFLNMGEVKFSDLDSFVEQIDPILSDRISKRKHRIQANKLQLSQLLYSVSGNISAEEVSKQIVWSNRQINRYLNKYIGVSLKTYLNIQKCYSSYFHIREGDLFPENDYYDQAHLIKEIKKHTGNTPTELYENQNDRFIQLRFLQRK